MKKLIAFALIAVMMLSFAGCGGSKEKKTEAGPLDGTSYTWDDLKDIMDWEYKLVFADGKVTKQDISGGNVDSEATGTYKIDGNTIEITIQGGTESGTINDDKTEIVIDDGGDGYLYHKD